VQVCDTIVTTVPKSVVHCLVRKAEKNLLNHMFGHVHKMSEVEIERMLQVGLVDRANVACWPVRCSSRQGPWHVHG
jgi:hypothetical protein